MSGYARVAQSERDADARDDVAPVARAQAASGLVSRVWTAIASTVAAQGADEPPHVRRFVSWMV